MLHLSSKYLNFDTKASPSSSSDRKMTIEEEESLREIFEGNLISERLNRSSATGSSSPHLKFDSGDKNKKRKDDSNLVEFTPPPAKRMKADSVARGEAMDMLSGVMGERKSIWFSSLVTSTKFISNCFTLNISDDFLAASERWARNNATFHDYTRPKSAF